MPGAQFVFRFGSSFVVLSSVFVVAVHAAQSRAVDLVVRAGEYVERYYARAQSLLATEHVLVQPIGRNMDNEAYVWRMTNEVRFEPGHDALSPARITRRLLTAKAPLFGPPFQSDCFEQTSFSVDPLVLLLPAERAKFRFSIGNVETVAETRAQRVDFTPLTREPPVVEWQGRCGIIRSAGSTRGRLWIVPATGEVLRYEDRLVGDVTLPGPPPSSFDRTPPRGFEVERYDTTIEYNRFAFTNPDETLLLPSRVMLESTIPDTGTPRIRITRTFSDYRRFLGTGRVLP